MTSNQLVANTVTPSSAGTATSCRCAQATNRHHSRSSEPTYSRQFAGRQMIELIRNVGCGKAEIANELAHTCAPARAHPTASDQMTNHVALLAVWDSVPRHTSRHQRLSVSNFHSVQWVINYCHRFPKPLWQTLACLRPQKSDLWGGAPPPTYKGARSKIFPTFPSKGVL